MSKYVIELGEDANMVQVISVTQSGNAYIDSTVYVGYLEQLNSDYINEHFGSLKDDAYKRGLEDGKAGNDKGCEGCLLQGTGSNICDQCCNSYANQWMARDDKIEVGDEVEWTGDKYIVTYINYDIETSEITDYDLLGDDGSVADHVKKCSFIKTGRHFDIESILEDMRK